jgi:hypothetical protein
MQLAQELIGADSKGVITNLHRVSAVALRLNRKTGWCLSLNVAGHLTMCASE